MGLRPLFPGNKFPTNVGGGGGHTIADEGTVLPAQRELNFVGSGVTVTDDPANGQTIVTIPGGAAAGIDADVYYGTNVAVTLDSVGTATAVGWTATAESKPGTSLEQIAASRIKALTAGWYTVSVNLRADGIDANAKLVGDIRKNSNGTIGGGSRFIQLDGGTQGHLTTAAGTTSSTSVTLWLNANDHLEVWCNTAYDTAGGATIPVNTGKISIARQQTGPQGVAGPQGIQGPQGNPGPSIPVAYVHTQSTPAATWTINHGLSFRPNVAVIDSANDMVEGDVSYPSATQIVLKFSGAFAGSAFLS